jgi:hypothetical protein
MTNKNLTKEQLWEKFETLPVEIQDLMFSVEFADTVEKLGEKYALHIDELGKVGEEIGNVLLGLEKPEDFLNNIATVLESWPIEKVGELVKDINTQVFFPIRESLRLINDSNHRQTYATPETTSAEEEKIQIAEPGADQKLFDDKMGKLFRLPKESSSFDPYREPSE